MTKIIHLNLFPTPVTVFVAKLDGITCDNVKEILPKLDCALINPKLICSYDQLTSAITRAVSSFLNGTMKTRSPYTEILFNLSPSTNVTESLKTFGIPEDGKTAIAVRIVKDELLADARAFENDLKTALKCGELFSSADFSTECDFKAVKAIYKPSNTSEAKIIGEVCSTIATKNI